MATRPVITYDQDGNVVEERTVEVPPEETNADSLQNALLDALTLLDDKAKWDAATAATKLETARQVLRALARLGLSRLDQP